MDKNCEDYRKKVEAQIKIWEAKLDEFKARAEKTTAEAKIEFRQQYDELQKLHESAKKHLKNIIDESAGAWSDIKGSLEESWQKISTAVETAWKKVR